MNFKISIIMAVYNVEDYLEESIKSVLKQNIGFKKNIQLILINDGSPDKSYLICERYAKKYPDNIVYIAQENQGVASARNKGLEVAKGEYINFCDPDDILSTNTCKEVIRLFEKYREDECSMVAMRMKFFGARKGYHILDYKFDKTKVVDLKKDYDHIQLSAATTFVKKEYVGDLKFDANIKYGEDCKFINLILIKHPKYIVSRECIYGYRKREEATSALDGCKQNKSWYINSLKYNSLALIETSMEEYGEVPLFIQHTLMYDLKWKLGYSDSCNVLNDDDFNEFLALSRNVLKVINPQVIANQKQMSLGQKLSALNNLEDKLSNVKLKDGVVLFEGAPIYEMGEGDFVSICATNIAGDNLQIIGKFKSVFDFDSIKLFYQDDKGNKFLCKYIADNAKDISCNGNVIEETKVFECNISLKPRKELQLYFQYKDQEPIMVKSKYAMFSKLSNRRRFSYFHTGNIEVKRKQRKIIIKSKSNIVYRMIMQSYTLLSMLKRRKMELMKIRIGAQLCKLFIRKKIWLISDRIDSAQDNGIALFKYIQKQESLKRTVAPYFVISKDSSDYCAIQKLGKVIAYGSYKHKVFTTLADLIISSQVDKNVYQLVDDKDLKYINDISTYKLVFLQHGITKDDLSDWLKVCNKNISTFITAGQEEYKSIIQLDYGYDENVVKLTGFPRYDNLESDREKLIVVMPTWRKKIADSYHNMRENEFLIEWKNTPYNIFYTELLNNNELIEKLASTGYKLIFYTHPSMRFTPKLESVSKDIKVSIEDANYSEIFKRASLLISDYSSVPFDFAYLKKPVIYTQFSGENFFEGHSYDKGYFVYEEHGLGPVVDNVKDTVNEIMDIIDNDCQMEDKYIQRVEKFYKYTDKNNCKRVLEELILL